MSGQNRYGLWAAGAGLAALTLVGTLGDFSSPPVQTIGSPPRAADTVRRPLRPIPEVISKPKAFRVADTVAAAPRPVGSEPGVIRVVATDDMPVTQPLAFPAAPFTAFPGQPNPPRKMATAPAAEATPETAEIRDMMRSYLEAFNHHDATALASHWSAAGESVDLDSGETVRGRDAVAGVFAALFEKDEAAAIDIEIEAIKPVRADVALVDGVSLLSFNDATQAGSRFSAVVVREGGKWVLSSVRETAVPAPKAARRPLEQLDWLVGTWESIGEDPAAGARCSLHCSWNAGRSFLTRSHVVAAGTANASEAEGIPGLLPVDGNTREISEIIGWDPDLGQIRSWVFTSDGRFAEGSWSRTGESWQVRYEGRGADSGAVCTCTLERPGPDEIVTRAEPSPLVEILPPVTDFVRTAYLGM